MVILDKKRTNKLITVQKCNKISPILDTEKMKWDAMEETGKFEEMPLEIQIYKRRWLQLGLFFVYAAVNSMQWVQFTIVGNIISRYYDVSSLAVDATSVSFHVAYMILFFPASYVMDRVGLRWTCIIGALGTSIGAWIKVSSVSPDRFFLLLFGQAIVASSQIFAVNGPPRLAATWFGVQEVATATAIGCSGGIVGASLSFLITPMIVKNHERIDEIGEELSIFLLAVAVVCTVVTVALFFFFQHGPRLPPSQARALQRKNKRSGSKEFLSTFRSISTNKTFIMLWNSYGMSLGYLNAASTLLNPLYLAHFQNGETDAGILGLLMNLPGNFGAIIFGMILDKTKKFKSVNIFIYIFSLIGQIFVAFSLVMEVKWLVFMAIAFVGTFTISHASIGYELSAEATYPEPEELSSALLNMSQHVYGSSLVLIVGGLLRTYGDKAAHGFLTGTLTLGLILTVFTKNELRRQNAMRDGSRYEPVASSGIKQPNQIREDEKQSTET